MRPMTRNSCGNRSTISSVFVPMDPVEPRMTIFFAACSRAGGIIMVTRWRRSRHSSERRSREQEAISRSSIPPWPGHERPRSLNLHGVSGRFCKVADEAGNREEQTECEAVDE